jgi:hypothetical protein
MVSKKVTTTAVVQQPAMVKVVGRGLDKAVRANAATAQSKVTVEAKTNAVNNEPLRHPLLNPKAHAHHLLLGHQIQDNSFRGGELTAANDNMSPLHDAPDADRLHEAAMKLTNLSDSESRRQLEELWSSLSREERATFQRQLFTGENDSRLAPERAFYLFQLFGRNAPLEMALTFKLNSHSQRPQLSLHVGKEQQVDVRKFKPFLIGHSHRVGAWERHISNMFPSPEDILIIGSQATMVAEALSKDPSRWEKTLLPNGKYVHALITPYSGCYITISPDKSVEIRWAPREGLPEEKGLPDRLIPFYNYYLKKHGYKLSFTKITFDAFLTMMARRMVA